MKLKNGFEKTAIKFSTSSTSLTEDIGWINSNQLSTDIYNNIKDLQEGQFSKPIKRKYSYFLKRIKKFLT